VSSNRERVVINEVGLRDGIQAQPAFIATADKLQLASALLDAGLRQLEVASFVNPRAVPQMADAEAVLAGLPPRHDVQYTSLVLNERGYDRAMECGARSIATVTCTTDSMNQRNANMTLEQAVTVASGVIERARRDGVRCRAYLATAAECPFEGAVPPDRVILLAERMLDAGADEIAVADTIGAAEPGAMKDLLGRMVSLFGTDRVAVHFHDTRGLGVALSWVALEVGIRRFDSSIGGLGGCPFAPGAAGNLATEDLVYLLERTGFDTGVDFDALVAAVSMVRRIVGRPAGGRILPWYEKSHQSAASPA
jgi:hydroxymethylglutaryl-CoA lyase